MSFCYRCRSLSDLRIIVLDSTTVALPDSGEDLCLCIRCMTILGMYCLHHRQMKVCTYQGSDRSAMDITQVRGVCIPCTEEAVLDLPRQVRAQTAHLLCREAPNDVFDIVQLARQHGACRAEGYDDADRIMYAVLVTSDLYSLSVEQAVSVFIRGEYCEGLQ